MNDTLNSIFERRSIRGYKDEPVSEEDIELLKKAALASPTARNAQSWHFSFVTNKELIAEVESCAADAAEASGEPQIAERLRKSGIFFKAPLVVFISSDKDNKWSGIDAGIAVENLALAAYSLGLGSVIIGLAAFAFNGGHAEELGNKLGFPDNHAFSVAICIGTPTVNKEAHIIHDDKISDIN